MREPRIHHDRSVSLGLALYLYAFTALLPGLHTCELPGPARPIPADGTVVVSPPAGSDSSAHHEREAECFACHLSSGSSPLPVSVGVTCAPSLLILGSAVPCEVEPIGAPEFGHPLPRGPPSPSKS